jgi:RNA polymerase sigma-70 factor (ECF subfamily)
MFGFSITRFKDLPDGELVLRYRSTLDERYLHELFGRYAYLVLFLCNKYFENSEDSRDTTMEIFAKLAQEIVRHEVTGFKAWMYVVAKNFCIDKLRANKYLSVKLEPLDDEDSNDFMQFLEIDRLIEDEDDNSLKEKEVLKKALDTLDCEQKETILLFYYERKTYKEIMDLKQWDMDKVRSHLQNGRRNLKNYLEKRGIYGKQAANSWYQN